MTGVNLSLNLRFKIFMAGSGIMSDDTSITQRALNQVLEVESVCEPQSREEMGNSARRLRFYSEEGILRLRGSLDQRWYTSQMPGFGIIQSNFAIYLCNGLVRDFEHKAACPMHSVTKFSPLWTPSISKP
ncbi:uncharacterized protein PHALS_07362 [Plasmopara halstedii]|uniref:Uncharacterized protein n=1 Tax=Plasmopara halstedii TaxID=4781 RepID=A0A0P1B5X6_PLAHL|nr:uncharacterized protein PHALS_07362 [Plasmopara halstedii]CEG49606.1 hypothetical protein PHALS_07362 [Plasmopara halstedii]|eukprot:XP_024585975.1 hypothetical protein PHALS_07362 [Plasmopara halstedii]